MFFMQYLYKKDTKKKILSVTSQFLDQYGYNDTTYQMIADEIGISKSVISYHFESKPVLISMIFEEYVSEIIEYIRINLKDCNNYYLFYCIMHFCLYREVLKSERRKSLFFHKDLFQLWTEDKLHSIKSYMREIASDFNLDITDNEIHINAVINQGAKQGLVHEHFRNPDIISTDSLCYKIAYLFGLLSKLDEATILRNINRAYDFLDKHEYPKISFLS